MSMRELGESIGYTAKSAEQTVWAWEKERVQVPSDDLPAIADALGVHVCTLFGREASHQAPPVEDLAGQVARALGVTPERVEVNFYAGGERRQPFRGARLTRRLIDEYREGPEELREEWRQLLQTIREEEDQS